MGHVPEPLTLEQPLFPTTTWNVGVWCPLLCCCRHWDSAHSLSSPAGDSEALSFPAIQSELPVAPLPPQCCQQTLFPIFRPGPGPEPGMPPMMGRAAARFRLLHHSQGKRWLAFFKSCSPSQSASYFLLSRDLSFPAYLYSVLFSIYSCMA